MMFPVADRWVTRKNLPLGGGKQLLKMIANTPLAKEQTEESAQIPPQSGDEIFLQGFCSLTGLGDLVIWMRHKFKR